MRRLRVPVAARTVALGLVLLAVAVPLDARFHELIFRHLDSHGVRLTANGTRTEQRLLVK